MDILYLYYVVYCLLQGFPTRKIPQGKFQEELEPQIGRLKAVEYLYFSRFS